MLIVAINGSPDPDGNTAFLLKRILAATEARGAETLLIHAAAKMASTSGTPFCTVCSNPCAGTCFKGSPLAQAYETMAKADAIILGSPVYFGTLTAQLKAFFDKTRQLRNRKGLYNKIGAGVTVGASKYGGQETTLRALHDIMLVHGMILVGDGFGEADCGHHGVCAQRPASADNDAHKRADLLAARLVEVCRATAALRQTV